MNICRYSIFKSLHFTFSFQVFIVHYQQPTYQISIVPNSLIKLLNGYFDARLTKVDLEGCQAWRRMAVIHSVALQP